MASNYSGKQPHGNVQLAYNPGQAQHYVQSSSSGRPQVESSKITFHVVILMSNVWNLLQGD